MEGFAKALEQLEGVFSASARGGVVLIKAEKGSLKPREIIELASRLGCEVRALSYERPTLSEVFRIMVKGGGGDQEV